MAQTLTGLPSYGLVLSGDPKQPTLQNNSKSIVLIYGLRISLNNNGRPYYVHNANTSLLGLRNNRFLAAKGFPPDPQAFTGIPAGGSYIAQLGLPQDAQPIAVAIDGIVFDTGEFVGPNQGRFFELFQAQINGWRDVHQAFLDDSASGVDPATRVNNAIATALGKIRGIDDPQWMYYQSQYSSARECQNIQKASGAANAVQMAKLTLQTYVSLWRAK